MRYSSMNAWVYILKRNDGSSYAGSTRQNDPGVRVNQREAGEKESQKERSADRSALQYLAWIGSSRI